MPLLHVCIERCMAWVHWFSLHAGLQVFCRQCTAFTIMSHNPVNTVVCTYVRIGCSIAASATHNMQPGTSALMSRCAEGEITYMYGRTICPSTINIVLPFSDFDLT